MKLLVAGDARVDAGKTTFAAGLLTALNDAVGFKPRAGNDYWYDYDDAVAALNDGRLYGKDIATLNAVGSTTLREEQLNPVHRLWRPTPDRTGLLGEAGRTFLVDRVTTPDGASFVVNGVAEQEGLLPEQITKSLPLSAATRVESVGQFNDVMTERYLPAFGRVSDHIAETTPAVIESYADIALPVAGVDLDAVAVVGPTRVRLYDGSRYLKAYEVASGSSREGQLEERVDRIVEMIEPVSVQTLHPLSSDVRDEPTRVADAHADVYESMLDVARTEVPADCD